VADVKKFVSFFCVNSHYFIMDKAEKSNQTEKTGPGTDNNDRTENKDMDDRRP
jgi:hypothetical protein